MKTTIITIVLLSLALSGCFIYIESPISLSVDYSQWSADGKLIIEHGTNYSNLTKAVEVIDPFFPNHIEINSWSANTNYIIVASLYDDNGFLIAGDEIEINTFNNINNTYNLYLEELNLDSYENDDNIENASSIYVSNSPQYRTFHHLHDVDFIEVFLSRNTIYDIITTIPQGEETDTKVELLDEWGFVLDENDDEDYNSLAAYINDFNCEYSGTYYLKVTNGSRDMGMGMGEYTIKVVNDSIP